LLLRKALARAAYSSSASGQGHDGSCRRSAVLGSLRPAAWDYWPPRDER